MSVHVAILKRPYVDAILDGSKTVESRLSRNAGPPLGLIRPGERLYLKVSAGPFRGIATAKAVHSFDGLDPRGVRDLREKFEPRVGGDAAYWCGRAGCRYATFIELADPEPTDVGPAYSVQHMRAWYVLPDAADPVREVTLTAGAVRNGYVPLPADAPTLKTQHVTLVFPDGTAVQTDSYRGHRFRYRGWRRHFTAHGVAPGHRVRLTSLRPRRYRVTFPDSA